MFAFFRFGGFRLSQFFDLRGEADWAAGFLTALRARLMARIEEWKETHGELVPGQPINPQSEAEQGAALKSAGDAGADTDSLLLVVPRTDPAQPTGGDVPSLEGLELIFESPASGPSDLASVLARFSAQIDLDGPIMHLNFVRPVTDIPVPDFPG